MCDAGGGSVEANSVKKIAKRYWYFRSAVDSSIIHMLDKSHILSFAYECNFPATLDDQRLTVLEINYELVCRKCLRRACWLQILQKGYREYSLLQRASESEPVWFRHATKDLEMDLISFLKKMRGF